MNYYGLGIIFIAILSPIFLIINYKSIMSNEINSHYAKSGDYKLLKSFLIISLICLTINVIYCYYLFDGIITISIIFLSLVMSPFLLKIGRHFMIKYSSSTLKPKTKIYYDNSMVIIWPLFCGLDKYKRILGTVYGKKATCELSFYDVNLEMIRQGMAWYYLFTKKNSKYELEEEIARTYKIGLWSQKAIAPWDFRKIKRKSN